MRTFIAASLIGLLIPIVTVQAQRSRGRDKDQFTDPLAKSTSILDRAGGTHNKSNFSWFFENRGKLYPKTSTQGFGGEWPIGSTHEYVYRVNPIVALPGNVIQGRFTTDEEWEAAYGYSRRDIAKIAFSDNPATWPNGSWLVQDAAGKPVIVSNQDSYCVYNDSGNTRVRNGVGIQVNQIGYAFSQKQIRDMIYFTFLVINKSHRTFDSLYFGLYMDNDVGSDGSGIEWGDDKVAIDLNRQLVTFYDSKGYSTEWAPSNGRPAPTGFFGMTVLETPRVLGHQVGITDFHYNTHGSKDDQDIDTVLYGILSSSPNLAGSRFGTYYFHPGANLPNLHIDDVNTIPSAGIDVVAWMGSGPYNSFAPGDTLRFVTAWIAGITTDDYNAAYVHCQALYQNGYTILKPPATPTVTASPSNGKVTLVWDNLSEQSSDPITGQNVFEGYRIYRSVDKGVHWDQVDRNANPGAGADPIPIAIFDKINGVGKDSGIQHSYVDSALTNGFEYWYSVTAYSVDSTGEILESARGNTPAEKNIAVASPKWQAIGRTPVTASGLTQSGSGNAQVIFTASPLDFPVAGGRTYEIGFAPFVSIEQGHPRSIINISVDTVGPRTADAVTITFRSTTMMRIIDRDRGSIIDTGLAYVSGTPFSVNGLRITITNPGVLLTDLPATGDSLAIVPGIRIVSSPDTVLPLQPFSYGTTYVTSTDVVIALNRADTVSAHAISYNDKFSFSTQPAVVNQASVNSQLNKIRVVPNPYLVSSAYEIEYGVLRREPIRQLKFTNLPPVCTIYIFGMDGDRVKTISHNSSDGSETWDLRASGGREIAAGVYLYLVKTDGGERLDRFAVIK